MIHFSVFTYQGRCATHGIITNGPSLYKIREYNDDINNGLFKSPTYVKKKYLIKMSCYIGEFHDIYYQLILKKYA